MSRHQPFGFDRVCTSCSGVAFESAGGAGRRAVALAVDDAPDASPADRQLHLVRLDVLGQVAAPQAARLHDAAIHVDDIQVAVRPVERGHWTKPLIRRREKLSLRVAVLRLQPARPVVHDHHAVHEIGRRVGDERVAAHVSRVDVAAIDGRPARALNDDRRVVRAEERIAVAAVDAARVADGINRRVLLLDQQLVEAARPGAVGIAQEVARRRVVDEQRRVVHVAVDASGVVLRDQPLAAAQGRQGLELAVLPPQVPGVFGRVHDVVHRPEQAVRVVLDAAVRIAVGGDDRLPWCRP